MYRPTGSSQSARAAGEMASLNALPVGSGVDDFLLVGTPGLHAARD